MDEHLNNLFSRFHHQFGSGPGLGPGSETNLTKIPGITPPFIKSVYKASASLYRSDPWRHLRPTHLLNVKVGKDHDWHNRKQPFPYIQLVGGDLAIYMFRSESDADKMSNPSETVKTTSKNVDVLRVSFERESQMFRSHRKMIENMCLEVSGEDRYPVFDVARYGGGGVVKFRNLTYEEMRFVYGVIRGVCLVHPLLEELDYGSGRRRYESCVKVFKNFIETVDVQLPTVEMVGNNKGSGVVAVTVSYPVRGGRARGEGGLVHAEDDSEVVDEEI